MSAPSTRHDHRARFADDAWGAYSPKGHNRLLLLLVKSGLGHGPVRRWIEQLWESRNADTPVDIERYGLRFRLHPRDNTVESKLLFGSRNRDAPELKAIGRAVAHGGVFVDVGANAGFYSLMAARAGARCVLAIEPIPQMFARLNFNAKINGFEDVIHGAPIAVGDEAGEATLVLSQGDMGASWIDNSANRQADRDKGMESSLHAYSFTVHMKPLKEVVSEAHVDQIDAMKIDVEGMEDAVLLPYFENAARSLWPRLVVIEHVWRSRWTNDVLSWMTENGYTETKRSRSNAILSLKDASAS